MKHLLALPLCLILASAALTAAPVVQQAYVKAPNPDMTDSLGYSTAISGNTMVVGAPYEDGSGSGVNPPPDNSLADSGAAYVYVRSGGVWTFQAYLKASNPGAGDLFGYDVAIAGNTIVVGAHFEDGSGTGINPASDELLADSGAAYVFVRTGNTWTQQAYVKASNTDDGDLFGLSVAVHGDTVVVGATGEAGIGTGVNPVSNEAAPSAGAAYVFARNSTTWSQQAYLKASNTDTGDRFGSAVAISGDTLVVGAYSESGSGTGINPADDDLASTAGAAYVFTRNGSTWSFNAYLKASNTGANDSFGAAVTISGETIVIAAPGEDGSGSGVNPASDELAVSAGAAYAFVRSGSTWSQQAYLKPSNTSAGDVFGTSVSLSGSVLVVGATGEDGSGTGVNPPSNENSLQAGAAYVFSHVGTDWSQGAYLKASQVSIQDNFGTSVAAFADTVVIGAPGEDGSGTGINPAANELAGGSGAAFVFSGIDTPEIAVSQNAADIPDGGSKSFGDVPLDNTADLTFTITNSGAVGLALRGSPMVTLSGPDASLFSVTSQPATSLIAASGSTTFTVHLNASASGTRNALLTILNDDADEGIFRLQLTANVQPPEMMVTLNTVEIPDEATGDFGYINVGNTRGVTFQIHNTGNANLLLSGSPKVVLSGPNAAEFNVTSQPVSPVLPGGTTSFTVSCSPVGAGTRYGLLTIVNNDDDENPYTIVLAGTALPPEINVLFDGSSFGDGSANFSGGIVGVGADHVFTIQNLGGANLVLTGNPVLALNGASASAYTFVTQPATTVPPGGETSFIVRFTPASVGTKSASLGILNNDTDEGSLIVPLTGTGVTYTNDTDNDGLSDASEVQMAALGFNWQVSQNALVNTLFNSASQAGLYTTSQMQSLNAGQPLLSRNPTTGEFTLTLGVQKSTDLINFTPFPFTAPQCTVNGQGKLEFRFTVPGNAAFFRVEAQ